MKDESSSHLLLPAGPLPLVPDGEEDQEDDQGHEGYAADRDAGDLPSGQTACH